MSTKRGVYRTVPFGSRVPSTFALDKGDTAVVTTRPVIRWIIGTVFCLVILFLLASQPFRALGYSAVIAGALAAGYWGRTQGWWGWLAGLLVGLVGGIVMSGSLTKQGWADLKQWIGLEPALKALLLSLLVGAVAGLIGQAFNRQSSHGPA